MKDAASKNAGVLVGEKPPQDERRKYKRHTVSVDSQVEDLQSQAVINGRMTDLCMGGCYVDSMMGFPLGSEVIVRLRRQDLTFEAEARVVYAKEGLGMGMAFHQIGTADLEFLTHWIDELSNDLPRTRKTQKIAPLNPEDESSASPLQQLITMLLHKGALNQAEYEQLLREIAKSQTGK